MLPSTSRWTGSSLSRSHRVDDTQEPKAPMPMSSPRAKATFDALGSWTRRGPVSSASAGEVVVAMAAPRYRRHLGRAQVGGPVLVGQGPAVGVPEPPGHGGQHLVGHARHLV